MAKYVSILDYYTGTLNIIELTEDERKESEKYDDFESFLETLGEKYGFELSNCNWMASDNLNINRYKGGKKEANTALLAVESYFYYMWNRWGQEECMIAFQNASCGPMHFWAKWESLANKDIFGAAEKLFAELSEDNRELLVKRALECYEGRKERKV
jgi:hypothetical protein